VRRVLVPVIIFLFILTTAFGCGKESPVTMAESMPKGRFPLGNKRMQQEKEKRLKQPSEEKSD